MFFAKIAFAHLFSARECDKMVYTEERDTLLYEVYELFSCIVYGSQTAVMEEL
jgi:hypothetical protein